MKLEQEVRFKGLLKQRKRVKKGKKGMLYISFIFIKPLAFGQQALTDVTKLQSRVRGISVLQLERRAVLV